MYIHSVVTSYIYTMETEKIFDFLHFSNPTKEQSELLKALQKFISSDDPFDFMVVCGAAGTGKTSITSALIGYLNHINKPYHISAPTGRAARILGRKSGTMSSTIHSLIYIPQTDKKTGSVVFKKKIIEDDKPTVYIIDEASMISKDVDRTNKEFIVDKGLIFDLISYIKNAHIDNKIVFIGDHYQLPPVKEDQSYALNKEFLEETFNLKGHSFLLTEVKRQKDGSYILNNATDIRKAIDEGKAKHPIEGQDVQHIYKAADDYVKNYNKEGPEDAVTIGVSHRANEVFNDLVRNKMFGDAKETLEVGDLLMVTQNWSRNGQSLYNGDHVRLLSVDWDIQEQVAGLHFVPVKVQVLFSDHDEEIEDYIILESVMSPRGQIPTEYINVLRNERYIKNKVFAESQRPSDDRYVGALQLMYGHAITCNKAQGGEWKKVYINTVGIPSLKWQYTAITRGVEEVKKFGMYKNKK